MINTAIKSLENTQAEIQCYKYFKNLIKRHKEFFKQCYKALNPIEKYKVYAFIFQRDKGLADEICNIMTKKKVISFKIGG